MLQRWIDPQLVDWTDGLNPLTRPGHAEHVNAYVYRALNDPIAYALRQTRGQMRAYVAPGEATPILAPMQQIELVFTPKAFLWIMGVAATSQQAEGFEAQITNTETGETVWSEPAHSAGISNPGNGGLLYLPMPFCVLPPGKVNLQLNNLSANPNLCQLTVWVIEEGDPL
jgi:hypothetical protein